MADMSFGNKPVDGGNLLLKRRSGGAKLGCNGTAGCIYGSAEFIQGKTRYCLGSRRPSARRFPINGARSTASGQCGLSAQGRESTGKPRPSNGEMNIAGRGPSVIPGDVHQKVELFAVGIIRNELRDKPKFRNDAPTLEHGTDRGAFTLGLDPDAVCGKLELRLQLSNTLGWNTFPVADGEKPRRPDIAPRTSCWRARRISNRRGTPAKHAQRLRHAPHDETLERVSAAASRTTPQRAGKTVRDVHGDDGKIA